MHVTDTRVIAPAPEGGTLPTVGRNVGMTVGATAGATLGGRYVLGALLGRGGMAEVLRAHDEQTGRDVAVKLFRPDVAEARDLRRIRSEIRMLAGLNHPSLVHLYDASTGDERTPAYLVLELVDGPTLADLMRDGIPPLELARLLAQVSEALSYIHARGIVHRDVKPENILVSRDAYGRPLAKLADLGIARIADESHLTMTGGVIGTAAYLSPEQVTGEPVGTATDVYALGLVLLEGLTGRRAFAGTAAESAVGRTVRPPRLPGGLTPADAELLVRMTALEPGARISAADTRERLLAFSSPGPFHAGDPSIDLPGAATEVLPGSIPGRENSATRRLDLPTASTERLEVAVPAEPLAATRVFGVAPPGAADGFASHPTAATDVFAPLRPSGLRPSGLDTSGLDTSGWVPTSPEHAGDVGEAGPGRVRRSLGRRIALIVTVLLVLGVATIALWPTAASILSPAPAEPAPAYPVVEGDLGTHLGALQASVEGGGLATEALSLLRADALSVATAAAIPDPAAASTALDLMSSHLDAATVDDRVTSARYKTVLQAIGVVGADFDAMIAAAEAQAAAERAAQEAAEQAAAEQAAAEQAAAQEAAEEAARQAEEDANPDGVLSGIEDWWREQAEKVKDGFSDSGFSESGSGSAGSSGSDSGSSGSGSGD